MKVCDSAIHNEGEGEAARENEFVFNDKRLKEKAAEGIVWWSAEGEFMR